jgi:CheY-like chemotaxis protein
LSLRKTRKPLILCVEDDEAQRQLRADILEADGYSVVTVAGAADALRVFRTRPVCLVLADHMLKGSSGASLAQQLKKLKPDVPIVLHSGNSPESLRHIDAFVHKGEPVTTFLAFLRNLVDRYCA